VTISGARLTWDGLNALTEQQSDLESGVAGWAADANCSVAQSSTERATGASSLRLSSTGAGDMRATTPAGTSGEPVVAGRTYSGGGAVKTGASARSARALIRWYDAAGTLLSTTTGGSSTDATTGWVAVLATAAAPAGAAFAALVVEVLATGGAGELHYFDRLWFSAGLPLSRGGWWAANVSGRYVSAPDSPATSITSDLDLRVLVALDDPTSTIQTLVGKYLTTTNDRSFLLQVTGTGTLRLTTSADGLAILFSDSTAPVPVGDRTHLWARVTIDVNDGAGNRVVTFYTSTDPPGTDPSAVTWAILGTAVTTAGVTSIFDSIAQLELGSFNSGVNDRAAGRVLYAEVRNGIDGTIVASPDLRVQPNLVPALQSFVDGQGNAWTLTNVQGNQSGLDRWAFGAGDTFEAFEIERNDDADLGWQRVARITSIGVTQFDDWEGRLATVASYRSRWQRSDGAFSAYSPVRTEQPNPEGCRWDLTSNELATSTFRQNDDAGGGTTEWDFGDESLVSVMDLHDADGAATFRETEDPLDRFTVPLLIHAASNQEVLASRVGRKAFGPLLALARADASYVCVRDAVGGRWYAEIVVEPGEQIEPGARYVAPVQVIELSRTPSSPDAS